MTAPTRGTSRRTILKGALAGLGTATASACSADFEFDGRGVRSRRVGRVAADPSDPLWGDTPFTSVPLGPQAMVLPHRTVPLVTKLRVRSVHDGRSIAFRLEWDDPGTDDLTVRVDDFRDACAVLLAPGDADEGLRLMGSATVPATLLHWKADWQRGVSEGDEGLDVAFPNRSVDTYPIVWRTPPAEVGIDSYVEAKATEWLPAIHVANPVSGRSERRSPVEKAIAYGFSTTTTAPTQDAGGRGERSGGGWRVVIVKPLGASDEGEMALLPGSIATCAFAVWAGSRRDVGSRKCPSVTVHALQLDG